MRTITHFFKLGMAVELAYPADFFGNLITIFFMHLTRFLFLEGLFNLTPQLAGWTQKDILVTFVFTVLLSGLVDAITPSIRTFVSYAHSGRLEPYLVQPVDPRILMLSRWVRPGSLILLACITPLAGAVLYRLHFQPSWLQVIAGGVALGIGAMIILFTMATWSLSAFVTQRVLPTEFILRQILRLNQLPPALFGQKGLLGILLFLPVVLTSTVPAMIIARNEFHLLLPFTGALILAAASYVIAFRAALGRFNGTGG